MYSVEEPLSLSKAVGSIITATDSYGVELAVYHSMRAAALDAGVHNSTISKARSENRPVKGRWYN